MLNALPKLITKLASPLPRRVSVTVQDPRRAGEGVVCVCVCVCVVVELGPSMAGAAEQLICHPSLSATTITSSSSLQFVSGASALHGIE